MTAPQVPLFTHRQPHPLAGKIVIIQSGQYAECEYKVEDWADRVFGFTWSSKKGSGNIACVEYTKRTLSDKTIPLDYEVVYGKLVGFVSDTGKLIHVSQLPQ